MKQDASCARAAIMHLAMPVDSLEGARRFYVEVLGCEVGRTEPRRMDINFFGHHVVLHLAEEEARRPVAQMVAAGDIAPVRHFGAILAPDEFDVLMQRIRSAGVGFMIEPHVVRAGTPGQQAIALVSDGCGNVVEFKGMPAEAVFAK